MPERGRAPRSTTEIAQRIAYENTYIPGEFGDATDRVLDVSVQSSTGDTGTATSNIVILDPDNYPPTGTDDTIVILRPVAFDDWLRAASRSLG